MVAKKVKDKLVNTAKLIRGRVYVHKNKFYYRKQTHIIEDEAVLEELAALSTTITDSDGEEFKKNTFKIRRNVPASKVKPVIDGDPDDQPAKKRRKSRHVEEYDDDDDYEERPRKRRRRVAA